MEADGSRTRTGGRKRRSRGWTASACVAGRGWSGSLLVNGVDWASEVGRPSWILPIGGRRRRQRMRSSIETDATGDSSTAKAYTTRTRWMASRLRTESHLSSGLERRATATARRTRADRCVRRGCWTTQRARTGSAAQGGHVLRVRLTLARVGRVLVILPSVCGRGQSGRTCPTGRRRLLLWRTQT